MKSKIFNFLLMILIAFVISGNGAYATSTTTSGAQSQEEEEDDDDEDDGDDDVEDDPVEPNEGTATIIEHSHEVWVTPTPQVGSHGGGSVFDVPHWENQNDLESLLEDKETT